MFCMRCAAPLSNSEPASCPDCGELYWNDAHPAGAALLVHQGRLLMVRRANQPWQGHWDLPGGFCMPLEHPMEAAVRETREETGLAVRITGLLGLWNDDYLSGREGLADKRTLCAYYHAVLADDSSTIDQSDEVSELSWFEAGALPEPLSFPGHVPAVLAAWREALRRQDTIAHLPDRPDHH